MPISSLIPSTDEVFGWIETVFGQGVRRPGYPADRWSEIWIRDQFSAFGLDDVRFEPVPLPKWEDTHTSLSVWPADRPNEEIQLPCFACRIARGRGTSKRTFSLWSRTPTRKGRLRWSRSISFGFRSF